MRQKKENTRYLQNETSSNSALKEAHVVAVLTKWDEFITYDWQCIYNHMYKPAFISDRHNILDQQQLEANGFEYKGIGS